MRGMVFVLLIVAIISLFSFIAFSMGSGKNQATEASNFEFKTYTSAVCEEKSGLVYCRDELFVSCNGKISRADEIGECNGFQINNGVTGFAVFESGWEASRA